tara:strand:+ start:199 stop:1659 length:1461 start_codon:yes stop_codon:yes gene_type:complete
MHILQATSEFYPYSKTGGLADMVAGLSGALADMGHEVTIVTPLYRGIKKNYPKIKPTRHTLRIPMGRRVVNARVQKISPQQNLTVLFVEQPKYYDREGIYMEKGSGYADNPDRFIFFSKAVIELANIQQKRPDVIHCHDWQAGLIPLLQLDGGKSKKQNPRPGTCMTIHNLAYQGNCDAKNYQLANLPKSYFKPSGVEYYGQLNFLKAGLIFSDQLATVSPQYATEIMTPQFGEGLDGVLRQRANDMSGILNGVNYRQWRTTGNPHLPFEYSAHDLSGKYKNKVALIRELGLQSPRKMPPLYAYVGRLADQKGVDLMLEALPDWLGKTDSLFALLGSGEPWMEDRLRQLQEDFPGRACCHIGYSEELAHRIEAAADFFLMPSKFEPCGLNQLYSFRYGTIPIVNNVGGLSDTVNDIRKKQTIGNGFKLAKYSSNCLLQTLRASSAMYANKERLRRIRKRAMLASFDWINAAKSYLKIYATTGNNEN